MLDEAGNVVNVIVGDPPDENPLLVPVPAGLPIGDNWIYQNGQFIDLNPPATPTPPPNG